MANNTTFSLCLFGYCIQEINHSDTYEVPAGCITDNYVPMKGQLSNSNGSISP